MENECSGAQGESQNSFGSFSLQRTSLYAVEGTSGSGIFVQSRKSTLEAKELGNLKKKKNRWDDGNFGDNIGNVEESSVKSDKRMQGTRRLYNSMATILCLHSSLT